MHLVSTTEPNATFPPSRSTSSLILFLSLLFQSTTTPYSSMKKKKTSNRLSFLLLSLFILFIPYRVLPFFFFFLFLFFFPPVFQSVQRVVSFAPITRHRAIPYPEGDRNGKILSAPVTCKCGNVFRHYGMYYSKNRSHWPRIAIRSWSTMASKRRGFPFL